MTKFDKALAEANDLYKEGKMSEATKDLIMQQAIAIRTNYDRLMYCKYLVEKPPRFIEKFTRWIVKNKKPVKDEVVEENDKAIKTLEEATHE